ncbi:hypothetical protein NDA14_003978 [Ustilago hordei]|nr:hypothetical protein NDA14_003978 [Ustilago hordei]
MSSAEKNYEIHDKELLAVYRPGDKGGEPDALTRRADMQPAGEEQDHNMRQLLPPRVGGRLVIPKVTMPGRTNNRHSRSAKEPLATPDRPWGSISLDFIEGLPPSKNYDSILVIVDRLTKFAILAPTHKTVTAKQTASRNGQSYHHFLMKTSTSK